MWMKRGNMGACVGGVHGLGGGGWQERVREVMDNEAGGEVWMRRVKNRRREGGIWE